MDKIELLKSVDFGESVAELEAENLRNYFLETHHWQQIRHGEVDVVYGPKGSGKSAIYSLINDHEPDFFQENIILKFAENPRGIGSAQNAVMHRFVNSLHSSTRYTKTTTI